MFLERFTDIEERMGDLEEAHELLSNEFSTPVPADVEPLNSPVSVNSSSHGVSTFATVKMICHFYCNPTRVTRLLN